MNKKGFTLIEVLIGLIILAIGILAIAGMQIISVKGNFFSSNVTQATILGQEKLEELKNIPYDNTDLSIGEHNEGTITSTIFSRKYNVAGLGSSMKKVAVTVEWLDKTNHSISLNTILSE
jgi:type IV pilus assembly protein PilV